MAHVELPQEELQPLIMSMKRVFAPFVEAIPAIVKIPQEMERLTETIKQDVKSGQPDRFVSGSKKSKDSVDMIGMMRTYIDSNSDEGKKRQKELEDLEKIAQERAQAEADLEKILQTGTPAEITEDNKVNILNEKEILEKQKQLLKTQDDLAFLEQKIAEEKRKGGDADSDELVRLQDALENNNTLLQEQTEVLGDRLPRQKVPETVGARDFIPGPLMEAYDNIAETAMESSRAIGSIFQPLIGLKKLFTQKEEYEEDDLENRENKDKKLGLSVVLTTLKFVGLTLALAVFLKAVYDLAKKFGFISGLPKEHERQSKGMFLEESDDAYKQRLMDKEGLTAVEAGKIVRANTNEFDNPIARLLNDSRYGSDEDEIAKDKALDKKRFMSFEDSKLSEEEFIKKYIPGTYDNSSPVSPGKNNNKSPIDRNLLKNSGQELKGDNQVAIGNVDNSTINKIHTTASQISASVPYEDVIRQG